MEAHDIPDPDEHFFGGATTKLGRSSNKPTTPRNTPQQQQHALQSAQASSFTFEEQDVNDDAFTAPPRASTSAVNSPFLSLVTIHNEQDLMQTISTWPKYISRIRNRFGAMEGKLICMGDSEIKLLPLQESNYVEDADDANAAETQVEDKVHCWTLSFRDITSLRVLGFNGCWVEISTSTVGGCDLFIRFETPAWRSHFTQLAANLGVYLTRTFPGGEDCVLQDIASFVPAQEHRLTIIKGIANTPYARTFCFLFQEKQLVVFRPQDMFDNQVPLDTSVPFARHAITQQCTLEHKPVAGARIRSRLIVDSATQYELSFASMLERERFQCALQTIVCGCYVLTKPPQQQPAKMLRAAWKPANALHQWFSVKRSLYVGTFNVGDAAPPSSDLLDLWVCSPKQQQQHNTGAAAHAGKFAMYVFGLQECNKFEEWTRALHAHLGGPQEYALVSSTKLWEIGLVVFALHTEQITQVETNSVATGMSIAKEVTGVQLGNKGGVGVALRWHDTSFCFVNCHLSPHQEKSKERCANLVQILTKLQLTAGVLDTSSTDPVLAFDNMFVLGDLNFRVDETFQKVVQLSSQAKFSSLLELDQLNKEFQDSESCFRMFRDVAEITFPPTYRWERGRQAFSNKRDQPPSYTDRILIHAKSKDAVKCVQYGSSQDCMISDHRPVAATFVIDLKKPFMQWPMHPMQCAVKRDVDADEGVEALLDVGFRQQQQQRSTAAAAATTAAIRSSSHMMMRKTSKQTVQQQQHMATLLDSKQDQDEEDEPFGPFLGEHGSFFVSTTTGGPTIEIVNSNLKLLVGVPTNREAYLRAVSPRLVYADDDQFAGEPTTMYQVEFLWAQSPALRVRPMVFDPAYLAKQHLVVAIEHRSSSAAAGIPPPPASPRAPQHTDSDEGGIFDQIPAPPPTTPQQVEMKRPTRATTSALNSLRRNKTQVGSQVGNTAVQAAAAAAAAPVLVGYMSIPLSGLNNAANGGEVYVSSPVVNNLIQVGTFEGKLKVTYGAHEDLRRQIVLRKPEVNMFCLRTSAMEIYMEEKWKRAFVAVDCAGVLYVSLRVPNTTTLSKQLLGDFLTKNATWICDANSETTRLEPAAVDGEQAETSNRVRFDLVIKSMQAPLTEQTLILACSQESTKLLLQSVLHMFQSVKRYSEKDFLLELQHALKERITDRARRRQLEQEIQRKNAELAKKQKETVPVQQTLQSKASFISRVLNRKSSWFVKTPHSNGDDSSSQQQQQHQMMIKTKSFRGKMREETVELEVPGSVEVEEESTDSTLASSRAAQSSSDINDKLRERAKNTTLRFKTSSRPKIQ